LTKAACSEPDVSASGPAEPSTEKAQGAEAPKGKDLERPDPDSEVAPGEGSTPAGTGAEESSPSAEQPPVAAAASPASEPGSTWAPPAPAPDKFDWIQLTSGEWLKGEIKSMRDEDLEFESDELDDQKLDWDDIAVLRSPRRLTYVLDDRTAMTGTAIMVDGRVVVDEDGILHEFPRDRLMSIVRGDKKNLWGFWSGKGSVGVSFQKGNTDQTLLSYQGFVRRQTAITRTRLDFNGGVSVLDDEQNENRHMALLKFDIFVSPRFYVTPASIEAIYDRFQNIDYRLTPAAGVGYHLIKTKKVKCEIELAGGYQFTRYHSVEAGQDRDVGTGAAIPTVRLETEPHKKLDLDGLYRAQITFPEIGDTIQHGEVILSLELTKILDLDVSFFWDRVESPVEEKDGVIPKKDDYKLTVGLGVDF